MGQQDAVRLPLYMDSSARRGLTDDGGDLFQPFGRTGYSAWAMLAVTLKGRVLALNDKARRYFPELSAGTDLKEALWWFRQDWLDDNIEARVVKTSKYTKLLMEIVRDGDMAFVLLRNVDDYRNVIHLWCEVEDSLIRVQPFIDNSHDGIVITNGLGVVIAVNKAFLAISRLNERDILWKPLSELNEKGIIPDCAMMHVFERRRCETSIVKFAHGKETLVSSTPVIDKAGKIIRVLSNVRDITELKELHDKLGSAEAMVKHYQREVNVKLSSEKTHGLKLHRSRVMEDLYERVRKVADTKLPVLITGESGVGKTALAKYMHILSDRNETGSFIHINCSAIPETLLESELFGYEAGAFTGAKKPKIGLFEIAHKGTILLDEIGDMPLSLQAKLLNVLQEMTFYRVGGTRPVNADVRILAATNQNPEQLILDNKFRRDLYFRLNVIPIEIPPLRERREDVGPLIAHYLDQSNRRYERAKTLSAEAANILLDYTWPGNVRELTNLIDQLVILTAPDIIRPEHLPAEMTGRGTGSKACRLQDGEDEAGPVPVWAPGTSLKSAVADIESRIIQEAICHYGSLKQAARALGVDESTLTRKRARTRAV